jgi:hypothetical protein
MAAALISAKSLFANQKGCGHLSSFSPQIKGEIDFSPLIRYVTGLFSSVFFANQKIYIFSCTSPFLFLIYQTKKRWTNHKGEDYI